MSRPTTLSELLRENLKQLTAPAGYEEFKNRLSATKQTRRPPTIKVSPENNNRKFGKPSAEQD
jgi:hypothetical protein